MPSFLNQQNSSSSTQHYYALGDLLQGNDDQFVRGAYLAVLGRSVDSGGLDTYSTLLANGKSRVEVLIELRRSLEGEARAAVLAGLTTATSVEELLAYEDYGFVSCAYQTLLIRPVDAEALVRCVTELRHGAPRLQLLREILDSHEFKLRFAIARDVERAAKRGAIESVLPEASGGVLEDSNSVGDIPGLPESVAQLMERRDGHFIHGLYQLFLGRAADAEGFKDYRQRLSTGLTRRAIVLGISGSEERRARLAMLDRINLAIKDFDVQDQPVIGWAAALRCQRLDQMITKRQLVAMNNQFLAMQKNFQHELARVENAAGRYGNAFGMRAQQERSIKLNDLSPLARDIYFQLKSGLDDRKQTEA
jgi:Domain of unknown function (DUF4214)